MPVISVQYQPFGVQLAFTPTVLENGIINLRLAPSVSELNFARSRERKRLQHPIARQARGAHHSRAA